jgi:hypothetical protein
VSLETKSSMAGGVKGWTRAGMRVTFFARSKWSVKGWVQDMPEPDGNGAYVFVRKVYEDPDLDNWVRATQYRRIGKDANGAGSSREHFKFGPNKKRILLGVWVRLCEIDDGVSQGCQSEYLDNPRTLHP